MESVRTGRRTREATRVLLEQLITRGTVADLENANPEWLRPLPPDDGAFEWYSQFGDATKVMRGRDQLLQMVVELRRISRAPAASAFNAAAWFDEWVELPQPALGSRSPSQVLCTPVGLEASKVILRSLQEAASASQVEGARTAKGIRSLFRVFALALISIASIGLAARPVACAAGEVESATTAPLKVVVLPARAHIARAGLMQAEDAADWSEAARANIDAAVAEWLSRSSVFGLVQLPALSAEEQGAIDEFAAVANLATTQFDGFSYAGEVEVQRRVADRLLGPSLSFLHDRTGAGYAIGVNAFQLEQSKRLAGVGAALSLGILAVGGVGVPPVSSSYVALFLADLRTGELRWFNVESGFEVAGYNLSDLRDAESARKVVAQLLEKYPEVPWARDKKRPRDTTAARTVSPPQGGFAVQMLPEWRASELGKAIRATRDGRGLNEIKVELRDHIAAFPAIGRRTSRDSSPAQLAKAFVDELAQQELTGLEIIDVSTDAQLVGKPAFRVHVSYRSSLYEGGARIELVTIGTAVPRGLLIAQLQAPQLEFFDKAMPAFEEAIQTIVLKPRRHP